MPAKPLLSRLIPVVALALFVAGCAKSTESTFVGKPHLSLVGEGAATPRAHLPQTQPGSDIRSPNSLWSHNNPGLFGDRRAREVGDIVTIVIDIDDQAQFDNTNGRSHEGNVGGTLNAALTYLGFGVAERSGEAEGNVDVGATASSRSEGSIDRSERLNLSVAALVTEVLPGGNLLIAGSQEIRVNHEVRVLNIAGIVHPLDIGADNAISYEKIAEARISYGSRNRLSHR